jgi:hypothetical protein
MSIGKASIVAAGFVGAFVLGIAVGPSMTDRIRHETVTLTQPSAETSQASAASTKASAAASRRSRTAGNTTRTIPKGSTEPGASVAATPASEPDLQKQLKRVLNRGANMSIAAEGFRDAEQFATVAHAARNTEVPFMLLKHRVLNEGQTLEQAILASKPAADAAAEVSRARAAAQSDIAAITS